MRRPSMQMLLLSLCAAPALSAAASRGISIDAVRAVNAHVDARGIHLRLAPDDALTLVVDSLRSVTLGLDGRLEWSCTLQRGTDASMCAGPVGMRSGNAQAQAELRVRVDGAHASVTLAREQRSVSLELPFSGDAAAVARLQRVPAAWLRAPLAATWPGGEVRAGTFDAQLRWRGDGSADASYVADGVRVNTFDGSFGGDELALRGTFTTAAVPPARRVTADLHVAGGTLRMGAVRVAFPSTPVDIAIDARITDDRRWVVDRFAWHDPGALEFEAHGEFDPPATAPLRALSVTAARLVFPAARQRYAADLFAAYGIGDLALDGSITGRVDIDTAGLRQFAIATDALNLRDPTRALVVEGLAGGLDWRANGEGAATPLAWRKARVGDVVLGPTRSTWRAHDGSLVLQGVLRTSFFGGTLELEHTVLHPFVDAGERARTRFKLAGLGHEGAEGTLAAAHVAADGRLRIDVDAGEPRIRLDGQLRGGEVLAGAFYMKLPDKPVAVAIDLAAGADRWRLGRFEWNDPGVLAFAASGDFVPRAVPPVQALQVDLAEARLEPALQRYAQSWLATRGYGDLAAHGGIDGRLELDQGKPLRFAVAAHDVSVHDGGGRFAVEGLDGAIDWDVAAKRPSTTFGWRALEVFRLPFGAARAQLAALDGAITLVQPLAVDVLGGQLRLERFTAQPRSPRGDRYAGSFALGGVEMARLSELFGWPRFPGKLSGGIPEIEFAGDRIEFSGGLDLYAFDGHLGLSGLALERPFGVAPSLSADAHFENLDLEQVTSAFSFGGMSGRLFGTIGGLRLVDWSPVVFDAWLRTEGGGRMSYKAVNDLTAIGGGGGLSANLQTMALKLFDTFGYRRLGIRCILRDDVCSMGGIEPVPPVAAGGGADSSTAGYTIVEGSGLPRITIVGHRRRVDWPTLVRRLVEATRGGGPVIE